MCNSSFADQNVNENITMPTCVVQTENGTIRGYSDSWNERNFFKFKRIPFAKPPIGRLRFMPPSPIENWSGELDCTQDAPMPISLNNSRPSSEDCLYIEISSPDINPPSQPLPVMFWIGCINFSYCFDEIYDPTALNNCGVIFVRCGFRMGPFGFLSANDVAAPGNCGLKDIVMALKWVQANIKHFGGDPSNVTLFGSRSGASLVHLMVFSPSAAGLFHKAIIQNECTLNHWSLTLNPTKDVVQLAQQVGITKTDKYEIIEELRNLPTQTIMQGFYELCLKIQHTDCVESIFRPCIEEEFEGQQAFLTKSPISLLKSGVYNKVPMIIGSNNIDGNVMSLITQELYNVFIKDQNYNENGFKPFTEESKAIRNLRRQNILTLISQDNDHSTLANREQYLEMVNEFYFLYHINRAVRQHSDGNGGPIFYYIFNFKVDYTRMSDTNILTGYCPELRFLFPPQKMVTSEVAIDPLSSKRMVKMWTNFAKYGHPTPEEDPLFQVTWAPVENKDRLNFMSIGSDLTFGRNPFHDRMQSCDEINDKCEVLKCVIYFNEKGILW